MREKTLLTRIVSGGQTGADRGGLDAAIKARARNVPLQVGGWCPKGRLAEDGRIPDVYPLTEAPTSDYLARTRLNVRDSDATVIFYVDQLGGGSLRTKKEADRLGKPCLLVDLNKFGLRPDFINMAARVSWWLEDLDAKGRGVGTLNVAGSRGSRSPAHWRLGCMGFQEIVCECMTIVISVAGPSAP